MGNGSHIPYANDIKARSLQGAYGRLPPTADAFNENIDLAQAMFHPFSRRILGHHLRRIGRALPRTLEANGAGTGRSDHIPHGIGQSNNCIIESRLHIGPPHGDYFPLSPSTPRRSSSHSSSPAKSLFLSYAATPARHSFASSPLGASVSSRPLAMNRQPATMSHAPIAADLDEPPDI